MILAYVGANLSAKTDMHIALGVHCWPVSDQTRSRLLLLILVVLEQIEDVGVDVLVVEDLGENVSLVGVLEFEFLLSAVKGAACRSAVTGAVCVVSLGIIFSATIIIRFAAGHVQLRCTFNSGVVGTVQRVVLKFIVRVSGCAARPGCVGF